MAKKRYSRMVNMNARVEINNLPEDVMYEILSRLSVKTLVSLRCVCQLWRSYISHPHFANFQLGHNMMTNPNYNDFFIAHRYNIGDRHKLYVVNKNALNKPPVTLNLPSPTCAIRDKFIVVGSCNGLLCLANYLGSQRKKRQHRIYLWNPFTRQHKEICMQKQNLEHSVSLGFAFDNVSRDYKVVSILTDSFHFVNLVSVYSLGRDSSCKRIHHVGLKVRVVQHCAVIVKGLFYWLIEENSDAGQFGLVSFDVQSGQLGTTILPYGISCRNLFELKGSLAASTGYIDDYGIEIWKQDDGLRWIKIHTIMNTLVREFYACLNTGEFVEQTDYGELALCDPAANNANKVIKYSAKLPRYSHITYNYSASLVKN